MPRLARLVALTIPMVTVWPTPKGSPMDWTRKTPKEGCLERGRMLPWLELTCALRRSTYVVLSRNKLTEEDRVHVISRLVRPDRWRPDNGMYRFKSGKLAGMTMQHAILKRGARLYGIAAWAEEQVDTNPRLCRLVREFQRLKNLLNCARVKARCEAPGCKKRARWMTFEATYQGYVPSPDMWCDKHCPPDDWGENHRTEIGFDALGLFKTKSERRILHKRLMRAWGIQKGVRITEDFARHFFDALK